jgi:hypothetical protein
LRKASPNRNETSRAESNRVSSLLFNWRILGNGVAVAVAFVAAGGGDDGSSGTLHVLYQTTVQIDVADVRAFTATATATKRRSKYSWKA